MIKLISRNLFIAIGLIVNSVWAQDFPYEVKIKPKNIDNFPAIHSYAFASDGSRFLIIGGRTDGLHPRQPWAAFDANNSNANIFVYDQSDNQVYSSSISNLSNALQEQLSSSNMNFHQIEDTLYVLGGYGYSNTAADHVTYPNLTTVLVKETIDAIINGSSFSIYFKQIKDQHCAVTGGHMGMLNDQLILVGGHRFDGRYNPMGHNTYVQRYTNEIRYFEINNGGIQPIITHYDSLRDTSHLHRRDYNLVPFKFTKDDFGYLISAGVFQPSVDLPYLYPVAVQQNGITPYTNFNQYLSHYHSADVSIYNPDIEKQFVLFFGGISQYDLVNEMLVKDDNVPFVKTISLLSYDKNGNFNEFKLNEQMPAFLGSGAEFFINSELSDIHGEMVEIHSNGPDSILLGYIVGGIQSSTENPFTDNSLENTQASTSIYEVYLYKWSAKNYDYFKEIPAAKVYPNPSFEGKTNMVIPVKIEDKVDVKLYDLQGKVLHLSQEKILTSNNTISFEIPENIANQVLIVEAKLNDGSTFRSQLVLSR